MPCQTTATQHHHSKLHVVLTAHPSTSAALLALNSRRGSSGEDNDNGPNYWDAFKRSKFFRVKISDKRTRMTKLETRIPAGFIGGVTTLIPQVKGFNLEVSQGLIHKLS
eukprot:jgi/Chrzof1/4587/Cz14g19090.t1